MATTENSTPATELDAGMMVRRALFLLALIGLTYYFLGLDFRGLSHATGMDQAQISREIARKNGFSTKFMRPLAWKQHERRVKDQEGQAAVPSLLTMPDTYHSPLNPLVNSIFLGMAPDTWKMGKKDTVYTPDIIIASVSMVLLLASVGISYLLLSRIFDPRIGGVTALLMLLCETLWRFSQSGLPQMLMLFLFSFGTYFLYKAIENQQAGRSVYLWIALTAGFFGLLALAHWLTLWMFFGLLLFASFYFTPRGVLTFMLLGIVGLITLLWVIPINYSSTGNPFGAGLYTFYAGLGGTASEASLFRDLEQSAGGLNFAGFLRKIVFNSLGQIRHLYDYLGGIVVAPMFFLSLLHPFRRREIADFRWCILGMWVMAVLGMTLYGLKEPHDDITATNNLHILFIPLMTGYGLAFLSVLWNRLNVPLHIPVIRNGHFVLAVLVSSLPFIMSVPIRSMDLARIPKEHRIQYPNYIPAILAEYGETVDKDEVIISDIPWAVAWYMDRSSFWLPKDQGQLTRLMQTARDKGQPITGMLLSPQTLWLPMSETTQPRSEYFDWRQYIMFYPALGMVKNNAQAAAMQEILTGELPLKYPRASGSPLGMVYLFMRDTPAAPAAPANPAAAPAAASEKASAE